MCKSIGARKNVTEQSREKSYAAKGSLPAIVLASSLLLSACATDYLKYVAPSSGATAVLDVTSLHDDWQNQVVHRVTGSPEGHLCSKEPEQIIGILNNDVRVPKSGTPIY